MTVEDLLLEKDVISFKATVDQLLGYAKEKGGVPSLFCIIDEDSDKFYGIHVQPNELGNASYKQHLHEQIAGFIKDLIKEGEKPYGFLMVTEVYVAKLDSDDPKLKEKIKEMSKGGIANLNTKEEAVLVHINTKKGTLIHVYDLIRGDEGDIVLAPEPWQSSFVTKQEFSKFGDIENSRFTFF